MSVRYKNTNYHELNLKVNYFSRHCSLIFYKTRLGSLSPTYSWSGDSFPTTILHVLISMNGYWISTLEAIFQSIHVSHPKLCNIFCYFHLFQLPFYSNSGDCHYWGKRYNVGYCLGSLISTIITLLTVGWSLCVPLLLGSVHQQAPAELNFAILFFTLLWPFLL